MVIHVLKDGSVVEDIRGIVITEKEFPEIYRVIRRIQQREREEGKTDGTVCASETSS